MRRVSGGGSPNLDEFSGPFNLASCGFVAAPPLIAIVRICSLELREGHGGWSLAYKKWETKGFHAQEPTGSPWFQNHTNPPEQQS